MMGDEAAGNIHDFDEIDLIALRRRSRILPGQLPAVGEERSGAIPAREFVAELAKAGCEERPNRGVASQNSLGLVRQGRENQRRFEDRIVRVQRHQTVEVAADDRRVPAFVNVKDFGIAVRHCCLYFVAAAAVTLVRAVKRMLR